MRELVEDVASSDAKRAEVAIKRLIRLRDPACVVELLPLAVSEDIEIQSRAVMILSHFTVTQHRAIWKFMSPLLLRGARNQKVSALLALEDLPIAEAVPDLKRFALRAGDAELRAGAVACLTAVARVEPTLRPGLRGIFEKAATSRSSILRLAGLEGLNELQDSRYDRILLDVCDDSDPGIRACFPKYTQAVAARKGLAASKKRRS